MSDLARAPAPSLRPPGSSLRPSSDPGPPRARISLRLALSVGIGSILVALLASTLAIQPQLFSQTEHRASERKRYNRLIAASQLHLIAMLDQEVGLRAYVATGDRTFLQAYNEGAKIEQRVIHEIEQDIHTEDRGEISLAWVELQRKANVWHTQIAEPNKRDRDAGPLLDLQRKLLEGKRRFDEIRVAQATLENTLRARSEKVIAEIDQDISKLHAVSIGAAAFITLFGILLTRFILKHTALPLSQLARTASARKPFALPSQETRIEEVHTLWRSLYELDRVERERDRVVEEAHKQAVALGDFGAHVQQISDEGELQQSLARTLDEKATPDETKILVRNNSRNRLEIVWPPDTPSDEQYKHAILNDPIKCRAARTLRAVSEDAGSARCCQCSLGVPEQGSYFCSPMIAAGELVGIVNLQSRFPNAFPEHVQQTTQGYIGFASTTLSSIRLLASARERALRDALTGAYNRAFLSEFLHKQLSQAKRRSSALCVLMLDLDHFKRLNDTYGHQTGDKALIAFVACMNAQLRDSDAVVRYGGEEFVVVLPDTDLRTGLEIAERIRFAVAGLTISSGTEKLPGIVHSSIGVAAYPVHGNDETSLVAAADRALYHAKLTGRNRVISADEAAAAPS